MSAKKIMIFRANVFGKENERHMISYRRNLIIFIAVISSEQVSKITHGLTLKILF